MLCLMKKGESWRNAEGRGVGGKCHEQGKSARLVHWNSSWDPFVFRDEDAPFFWVWGGPCCREGG